MMEHKPHTKAAADLPLQGIAVLLAEDDQVNQLAATSMLERLGAEVTVASSGLDVQRELRCRRFDVVLMDIQMPRMDGLQETRWIRQQRQLANLPVVAHTANHTAADRERCLAAGMDDFLAKPGTLQRLGETLLRWAVTRCRTAPRSQP